MRIRMGAVLARVQGGCQRVIAYMSCSVWPTKKYPQNYSSFKLELLTLLWSITEKFPKYLMGADIEVFTDNRLASLERTKLGALEQRWVARLAQFKYKIHYKLGRLNGQAAALSRYPVERPGENVDSNQEDVVEDVLPHGGHLMLTQGASHNPPG